MTRDTQCASFPEKQRTLKISLAATRDRIITEEIGEETELGKILLTISPKIMGYLEIGGTSASVVYVYHLGFPARPGPIEFKDKGELDLLAWVPVQDIELHFGEDFSDAFCEGIKVSVINRAVFSALIPVGPGIIETKVRPFHFENATTSVTGVEGRIELKYG